MTELITSLAVLFVTAGVFLLVANHFSLSPVPFYILAGLVSGTFLDGAELIELAQWGIAFLVFVFGYRVNFGALATVVRDGEVAATTQLVVVGPLSFAIASIYGFDPINALYFAVAATLSSTVVGSGLLEREIRDNLVHGRLASSIHLFDDLLAVVVVLVLSAEAVTATAITSKLGYGVLFLAAALFIYRHGYPLLVRLTGGSDELTMMGSISILIGFLGAAELAGISIVVGAFAAGIAIRSDDTSSLGVINGIESLRDFFVAIFFVTLGALVTVPTVETLVVALTLVVLVVLVNPLVLALAFVYEGYDPRTAFLASTSLNQVSELSLVVVIQAVLLETAGIADVVFEAVILAAALTMVLTSFTREYEDVIFERFVEGIAGDRGWKRIDDRSEVDPTLSDHVVVVGYGRQGRWLVDACERLGAECVVIENDPVLWEDVRRECPNYVLGDAMTDRSWENARVTEARLVVSTVDHRGVSESSIEAATAAGAGVIVRAGDTRNAVELLEAGATYVSVPNVLAGDGLIGLLEDVLDGETSVEELRAEHRDELDVLERYGFGSRIPRDEVY